MAHTEILRGRLAALLAGLCFGCGPGSPPNETGLTQVIVSVGNLDGVRALRVRAELDRRPATSEMIIDQHLEQFVVEVPATTAGSLDLTLTAVDELGEAACVVGGARITGIALSGQQALTATAAILTGAPTCTLTIAPDGAGRLHIDVLEPAGLAPKVCEPQDPCSGEFPKGSKLRLTPAPDARSFVDEAGEGALVCEGAPCHLPDLDLTTSQRRVVFRKKTCSADGWCAEVVPLPGGPKLMRGVWGSGGDDVWVAGAGGTLLRFDGVSWRSQNAALPQGLGSVDLQRLFGTDPKNLFLVGAGGLVLHWDGEHWSNQFPTALPESFRDSSFISGWSSLPVAGRTPEVWLGGDGGVLLHWDGAAWRDVVQLLPADRRPAVATFRWSGVFGTDPRNVIIVGGKPGTAFETLRWDGMTLSSFSNGGLQTVGVGVFGTGKDDIWSVGVNSTLPYPQEISHFDGTSWQRYPKDQLPGLPSASLLATIVPVAVSGTRRGDVYAVGGEVSVTDRTGQLSATAKKGFITHFDGVSWRAEAMPLAEAERSGLWDVWASPSGDVFAVGADGTVLRRVPRAAFRAVASGKSQTTLRGVHGGTGPGALFIVGDDGTTLQEGQGALSALPVPVSHRTARLARVWQGGDGRAFAAGDNGLLRFDGGRWDADPLPVRASLTSVWAASDADALAAGADGLLFRRTADGWTKVADPALVNLTGAALTGVWSRGDAGSPYWVASSSGLLLEGQGRRSELPAFAQRCPNLNKALTDLKGEDRAGGDLWISGAAGVLVRGVFRGAVPECQQVPVFAHGKAFDKDIYGLWVEPGDAWAVGQGGAVLHWNGNAWALVPSGTTRDLRGVYRRGPDDVWAVGDGGTVLRYAPVP